MTASLAAMNSFDLLCAHKKGHMEHYKLIIFVKSFCASFLILV